MVNYSDMLGYTRSFDLLQNRIEVINQLLGYGLRGSLENPCRLRYRCGTYSVEIYGEILNQFKPFDFPTCDLAVKRLDAVSSSIWQLGRNGMLLRRANLCVL